MTEDEYAVTLDGAGAWQLDGDDLAASARQAIARRATRALADRSVDVLQLVNASPDGIRPKDQRGDRWPSPGR